MTGTASVNTGATSTSGNFIVGNYTQTAGTTLGGTDAANYSFAGFTSAANYTISQLALTGAAIAAVELDLRLIAEPRRGELRQRHWRLTS